MGNTQDMVSPEEALILLEPYRGKLGAYVQALGEDGIRAMWVLSQGSLTAAQQFTGYRSLSPIREHFDRLGLPVIRRNWSDSDVGRVHKPSESDENLMARYLNLTGVPDHALEVSWTVPEGTEYARLICMSCSHLGEQAVDLQRLKDLCEWIGENPEVRWLHHGDVFDEAVVGSPGRALQRQALDFGEARRVARMLFGPISKQCVGMMPGNHDLRIARALQIKYCPVEDLCEDLNIEYLEETAFIRYTVRTKKHSQDYDGYHLHGTGGGGTWGALLGRLERIVARNRADFAAHGHHHRLAVVPMTHQEIVDGNEIGTIEVPAIACGAFLKLDQGGYGAVKGYSPPALGAATVHLYLERHSVHART